LEDIQRPQSDAYFQRFYYTSFIFYKRMTCPTRCYPASLWVAVLICIAQRSIQSFQSFPIVAQLKQVDVQRERSAFSIKTTRKDGAEILFFSFFLSFFGVNLT